MKRVLLLGASGEIGNSLLARLLQGDFEVLGTYCSVHTHGDIRGLEMVKLDFTDVNSLKETMAHLIRFSPDIVINCVGVAEVGPLKETTDFQLEQCTRINFTAPLIIMRELLPTLEEKIEARIVHVSTFAASIHPLHMGLYAATKAALDTFLECLSKELPRNIKITNLIVGPVKSKMLDKILMKSGPSNLHALRFRFFKKAMSRHIVHSPSDISKIIFELLNAPAPPAYLKVQSQEFKQENARNLI